MKKLLSMAAIAAIVLSSCADSTEFTAQPYGWMDKDEYKIDGVEYEVCAGNIVWSVLTAETVVGLYEPINYVEPKTEVK